MSDITKLTNENYAELTKSGEVLIDFYADWCGPCKMMSPVLDQIKSDGKLKVFKVNIDQQSELSDMFSVRSIPAFFALRDGDIINQSLGACSKDELTGMFK